MNTYIYKYWKASKLDVDNSKGSTVLTCPLAILSTVFGRDC